VTWWHWRRRLEEAEAAVRAAELLRDTAQEQQRQAEELAPRVAAVSSSLQKLRTDNHFGPMIDAILGGGE
jgi:hypothetical protein